MGNFEPLGGNLPLPDDLIDAKQAARLARCHISAVYRWIFRGRLRGWKREGRYFVSRSELLALFRPVGRKAVQEEVKRRSDWARAILEKAGISPIKETAK